MADFKTIDPQAGSRRVFTQPLRDNRPRNMSTAQQATPPATTGENWALYLMGKPPAQLDPSRFNCVVSNKSQVGPRSLSGQDSAATGQPGQSKHRRRRRRGPSVIEKILPSERVGYSPYN